MRRYCSTLFLVIAFSIKLTFIQNVLSDKTGFAPISVIATVATKVFAAVVTSSPLPIFKAFKDHLLHQYPS